MGKKKLITLKTSRLTGSNLESKACHYLICQGLTLITKNYACKRGEIDLVMQDDNVLVFVEVRFRQHNSHGSSAESITLGKRKKIIVAAAHYLQQKQLWDKVSCRFDVVAVEGAKQQFNWIKNAFTL